MTKQLLTRAEFERVLQDFGGKFSDALNRTEARLLREALDDLFVKHGDAL